MSTVERNKGRLIPTGIDTENYTDEDFETLIENGFVLIDDEVYEVEWEVKSEEDCSYFSEVTVNPDGTIDFHTLHYNGGGYWTEVVEAGLKYE